MQTRVFFPQTCLDEWIVDGRVDLKDGVLSMREVAVAYQVVEAVHVLREVTESGDTLDVIGRVKRRTAFEELGAEIFETSMIVGETAYDVEQGWLTLERKSVPVPPAGTGDKAAGGQAALGTTETDEEVIRRCLLFDR